MTTTTAFDSLTDAQRAVALELLTLLVAAHVANLPPAVVTARKLGVKCCEAWEN